MDSSAAPMLVAYVLCVVKIPLQSLILYYVLWGKMDRMGRDKMELVIQGQSFALVWDSSKHPLANASALCRSVSNICH